MLIKRELVGNQEEVIETINCIKTEIEGGEDIQDVLLMYDLDLDDAVDLILCDIKPCNNQERSQWE